MYSVDALAIASPEKGALGIVSLLRHLSQYTRESFAGTNGLRWSAGMILRKQGLKAVGQCEPQGPMTDRATLLNDRSQMPSNSARETAVIIQTIMPSLFVVHALIGLISPFILPSHHTMHRRVPASPLESFAVIASS